VKLDGSMSMHARDVMIERFTNDPDCKVYTALSHDVDLTCKFLGLLFLSCCGFSGKVFLNRS
jgi:hypothetical protein